MAKNYRNNMAPTGNKQARDASGRFMAKDKFPCTTANTSPVSTLPTYTDFTKTSSRLSESYDLIGPTSHISTPFTSSPIITHSVQSLSINTSPVNSSTNSSVSSPVSSSANSPTNSPGKSPVKLPVIPTSIDSDNMAETVTPFHGDKEDESPEGFLRAFFRRMGDKSDEIKKAQFPYYLQPYSIADDWFSDLTEDEKKSWTSIDAAFHKRWPKKKQIKKTEEEYEDEILGRKLKTEDLGKRENVAGMEVYSHVAWADKMATSVKGAGLENPAITSGK